MPDAISLLAKQMGAGGSMSEGLFGINFPTVTLNNFLSIETEEVTSVSGLLSSVVESVENLNQLAHMAYCVGWLVTHPGEMLDILGMIASNALAVAYGMAERITSVLEGQIMGAISQVGGTILNVVTSVLNFLDALVNIYEAIKNGIENLSKISLGSWNDFMTDEDCKMMFAFMGACLMNKLFGSKLEEFERKITNKITETGAKINDAIAEELTDVNNVANYVNHESFMMNKATEHLNLFTGA